ncbi:hypothetical protein KXV92_007923 [Aspergillus fumigatus]|nr:hypothetical protein KXX42_006240 [Aspergillus fumigatus]KAH2306571.1 hypothetical protein KXV47_007690 [Aspergillus fumigatus]KAH2758992.1 hypothetical protein KXV94_008025 [Aspergillus fumigatus]KAH3206661.1 hypothetical protein KXV92_007923 [Aspergillus fumigatus]
MDTLKYLVRLLPARAEMGKELLTKMERRIHRGNLPDPTSFCHLCVSVDDREADAYVTATVIFHVPGLADYLTTISLFENGRYRRYQNGQVN